MRSRPSWAAAGLAVVIASGMTQARSSAEEALVIAQADDQPQVIEPSPGAGKPQRKPAGKRPAAKPSPAAGKAPAPATPTPVPQAQGQPAGPTPPAPAPATPAPAGAPRRRPVGRPNRQRRRRKRRLRKAPAPPGSCSP